ncbi:hypothetical protein BX070DRAFT_237860 [Coemansia spiralis]|nr:hypothetical protein BX070DRAFT_237860 [Coemansia spiralis]
MAPETQITSAHNDTAESTTTSVQNTKELSTVHSDVGAANAEALTSGESNSNPGSNTSKPLLSSSDDAGRVADSSAVDGLASSTDGTRATSGYYTPSQEFFPLPSAGDRQESNSKDQVEESAPATDQQNNTELVQGADSPSACSLTDSPVVISNVLRSDSAAVVVADGNQPDSSPSHNVVSSDDYIDEEYNSRKKAIPADDDSDIVPLAQSRVLIEANARDALGAQLATQPTTGDDAAADSGEVFQDANSGSSAAGLGISTSTSVSATGASGNNGSGLSADTINNAPAVSDSATRNIPAPIITSGVYDPSLELSDISSAARLRFSPDNSAKVLAIDPLHAQDTQKEIASNNSHHEQQVTPAPSAASAAVEEPAQDGSQLADPQAESSAQARAMGKYLFDVEEFSCNYYINQTAGRKATGGEQHKLIEPVKPTILEGIDIPHLVDHAEWLGKRQIFNGLVLRYYIANYDFTGMRIDECLRLLCSHIFLRGESQVIDRLLVALSQRYVECNPDTKLKTADVAHAVTYSTLLLNTDLHIADIRASDRMTKNRFVRNTIDTIAQFQSASASSTTATSQPDSAVQNQAGDSETTSSLPPQLPELDLSKVSTESSRIHPFTQPTGAETPASTSSRFQGSSTDGQEATTPQPTEHTSGLRSLVGSMASLNIGQSSTTVSRTSRDVARLMGGRGKRFSFFESSSSNTNGSNSANGSVAGNIAALASASAAVNGSQTPSMGIASGIQHSSSVNQAVSSPSSLRAFDRLRRKVSTNGAHMRSRSGTVSMDESPIALNSRPSISGSSHNSHHRDFDTLGSMGGRSISGGTSADVARPSTSMPNLAELSSVLKDVYTGIKNRPLGQPPFARQASLLHDQQQQQHQHQQHPHMSVLHGSQYSASHGLARSSQDHLYSGNVRTSMAFGNNHKHSLDVDAAINAYGRYPHLHGQGPQTAYADYDSQSMHGSASGRPSSVRSMPMHTVQRTRSITSINKVSLLNSSGPGMTRRPPQHPDPRVGAIGAEAMKRSGSSMINFGGHNNTGTMRSSPSSASMGMGYMPSTAYTAYMRSPLENQHIRSGVLVRKHLFERAGKKASHRAWRTCYVSVDRGTVAMYKMDGRHGGHPDGRELTDTSLQLGSVSLRHTMTHMLPSPGYSRSRPHVFALQLPSGGVYLFQTASEVELRDWVAACNYWAARESKAPYMIGGVYNMEYGWDNTGDFTLRFDEREAREDRGESLTAAEQAAEERRIMEERDASKGVNILEWSPPNNPMQRSDLDETGQLKALLHHITYLEEELVSHKKVQGSIEERFYPKTNQFQKAFSNWERKAQYILQELIKYQSYADVLQTALKQIQDEMTIPIPEELSADGSTATTINGGGGGGNGHSGGTMMTPHCESRDDMDEEVFGVPGGMIQTGNAPLSARAATSNGSTGLSASRASLPRKGTDPSGNPLSSKSLPIKELLAPASDKARNRASIIVPPVSTSSTNTAGSGLVGDMRRGSQAQIATSAGASGTGSASAGTPLLQ